MKFPKRIQARIKRLFNRAIVFQHWLSSRVWQNLLVNSGLIQLYQPFEIKRNLVHAEFGTLNIRECVSRWEAIKPLIQAQVIGSCLDIGCNSGFFTVEMAKLGSFCIGMDMDTVYLEMAHVRKQITKIENVVFINFKITPENVDTLPRFDNIIVLSVFHHWVRSFGFKGADRIMRTLAQKCQRHIAFETGQYNERYAKWAHVLEFMGDDPEKWIEDYLKSLGFASIQMAGLFHTTVSDEARYVFVAGK